MNARYDRQDVQIVRGPFVGRTWLVAVNRMEWRIAVSSRLYVHPAVDAPLLPCRSAS